MPDAIKWRCLKCNVGVVPTDLGINGEQYARRFPTLCPWCNKILHITTDTVVGRITISPKPGLSGIEKHFAELAGKPAEDIFVESLTERDKATLAAWKVGV